MVDETKFWNDCYAEGKTGWDRGDVHPALLKWLESGLLASCHIVVPGCGRGYEVVKLAENGFDVTAVDIANEPVQHLQKRLGGFESNSRVAQESVFDFRPSQPVDVVYEQTCLCAIDPAQRTAYEQSVYNWLKPSGKLFVLFVQKTMNPLMGPPFHCSLNDMKKLFPESRWGWPSATKTPSRFEHPSGKLFELAHVLTKRK